MRFLGHRRKETFSYVLHPPYGEARAELLARRPAADDALPRPFGRLFSVVVDIALDFDLVSVFLFADGTISIYSSGGVHSTGLRGASKVSEAAETILEDVAADLREFSPVDDIAALPLPQRDQSQVLARTHDGDLVASERFGTKREVVARLVAMGLILTQLERVAVIEGLDRVDEGEVRYRLAPEYRRIRTSLMDWVASPGGREASGNVASVTVEIGDLATGSVTSLFVFADGSTSVYRSDGTLAEGLSNTPGIAAAAQRLLGEVEAALSALGSAQLISLPQPGRVQFVARARLRDESEWSELVAVAGRAELETGSHPLSTAFARANEVLRIAMGPDAGNP